MTAQRTTRPTLRHRAAVWAVMGVFLLAALIGGIAAGTMANRKPAKADTTPTPAVSVCVLGTGCTGTGGSGQIGSTGGIGIGGSGVTVGSGVVGSAPGH